MAYGTSEKSSNRNWLNSLLNKFESLMTQLDAPEEIVPDIRAFLLETAREQYKVGNRSGIRWARMNPTGSTAS